LAEYNWQDLAEYSWQNLAEYYSWQNTAEYGKKYGNVAGASTVTA